MHALICVSVQVCMRQIFNAVNSIIEGNSMTLSLKFETGNDVSRDYKTGLIQRNYNLFLHAGCASYSWRVHAICCCHF